MITEVRYKVPEEIAGLCPEMAIFVKTFFLTRQKESPKMLWREYTGQIKTNGASLSMYQENRQRLMEAFKEITGYRPDEK